MDFEHFVAAQDAVYEQVVRELAQGRKTSHWIWFIFPQLRGLGSSEMSQRFAIESVDAAAQYLRHAVLGPRLLECTQLVLGVQDRTAEEIFGSLDCMKFGSSMTLFSLCTPPGSLFGLAIGKYFAGERDRRTLELLGLKRNPPGEASEP
jgi:uncharacterized protein (DUF1810 family)